jgi:hypothetical protein
MQRKATSERGQEFLDDRSGGRASPLREVARPGRLRQQERLTGAELPPEVCARHDPLVGVEDLLLLSRSEVWSDRMDAGRELSAFAGTSAVDGELHRLLVDPGDTAVTDATAQALLRRGDAAALRVFAAAWSLADAEIGDHLYGCLSRHHYKLACAAPEDRVRHRLTLRQLLTDSEQAVRSGARDLLDLTARSLPD